jgi:hypothetical protein
MTLYTEGKLSIKPSASLFHSNYKERGEACPLLSTSVTEIRKENPLQIPITTSWQRMSNRDRVSINQRVMSSRRRTTHKQKLLKKDEREQRAEEGCGCLFYTTNPAP